METICGQAGQYGFLCGIYDFQTLLTGALAIVAAIFAGVPVWRQLSDTNLQTRISHRGTLSELLRDALRRYERVDKSISEPLATASRLTSDYGGDPIGLDPHDAHYLEQTFSGFLDWYLVVLADTETAEIEAEKKALKASLERLTETLGDAHWADHNEQQDEDHDIPDEQWAQILTRCAEAKIEAAARVGETQAAYRLLRSAQEGWTQALRDQIAQLDLQIAGSK
ncbi:MAG TPA: hypothetical protein VGC35_05850 [Allosphingosinicella sp.]|jgi:hypothetical protein